jgi:hypothetical protein
VFTTELDKLKGDKKKKAKAAEDEDMDDEDVEEGSYESVSSFEDDN